MTVSSPVGVDGFRGSLVLRGEDDFEHARVDRIFNRRLVGRQPAAVLQAECVEDVVLGVRLARERGWKVAVRSGGHSWAQWSVRDDALVIDLGALREMTFDAATGIASASPAVRGGMELGPFLEEQGRFFPGGHCPTVGIGGFLLQGGQGWNCRGWGWAAEYVEAIDVVTAAGELVRADAGSNSDLYWAARGAGPGFFGVVVRFHLRTRPRPGYLAHTVQAYAMDEFDGVMTWLHGIHGSIDDRVEIVALTKTDLALSPEPVLLVTAVALVDTPEEAEAALAPFRSSPALDRALMVRDALPTSIGQERARQLVDNPEGHRWVVDNAWLSGTAEAVVPAMKRAYTTLPSEKAFTIWFSMAPLRQLPDMAFSLQSEIYLAAYVPWEGEEHDQLHREWLDEVMADLEPVTVGQYLGDSDLAHRQVKFLSDDAWARLQEIRAQRDPDELFVGYLAGDGVGGGATNRNHWEQRSAAAHPGVEVSPLPNS